MTPSAESTTTPGHPRSILRGIIVVAALAPVALLLALLAWGIVWSEGSPGGFGINSSFDDTRLKEHLASDFIAPTLDGQDLRLSDSRGKVVMLDFWTPACPPCRQEAKGLGQVYREYQDRGVQFIGVAVLLPTDRPGDLEEYVEHFQITYPNVVDDQGKVTIEYGVYGFPDKFFISRDGNVVRRFVGPTTPEALREVLDELLGT